MKVFAGYRLQGLIGRGGFGAVYRAHQISLDRVVALKVWRCPKDQAEDILAEARILGRFDHPNLVRVFDTGTVGDIHFMAMELLEGETLAEKMSDGLAMTSGYAIRIARDILRGLSAVHAKGVVHRDLKASNVFITSAGPARVIDFGLADTYTAVERSSAGTPPYMAPEQWKRRRATARTDLYALGVILFRMLTARTPWPAKGLEEWEFAHLHSPVPTVPDVPERLASLIRRLMAKNPMDRPAGAGEVLEDLELLQHENADIGEESGIDTVQCSICDTPNPPLESKCRGCGERIYAQVSLDSLL